MRHRAGTGRDVELMARARVARIIELHHRPRLGALDLIGQAAITANTAAYSLLPAFPYPRLV